MRTKADIKRNICLLMLKYGIVYWPIILFEADRKHFLDRLSKPSLQRAETEFQRRVRIYERAKSRF
jgi:hypothetical protein